MPALWIRKTVWDGTTNRDKRILEATLVSVQLGEPALYENPALVQWYVWDSPELDTYDLTTLGSQFSLLQSGNFPYSRADRMVADLSWESDSKYINGILVGSPAVDAPLYLLGDNLPAPTGGEDVYSYVFGSNASATVGGTVTYADAGTTIPGDFTPVAA